MKDLASSITDGRLREQKFRISSSSIPKDKIIYLIEEIEYKKNRLVMFLNSPYSIHGVTKRSKTNYYRKYINIIGEFNFELFNYRNFLEK